MKSFLGQDLFKKMPFATRPKFMPLPQLATMAMDRGGPYYTLPAWKVLQYIILKRNMPISTCTYMYHCKLLSIFV